MMLLPDSSLTAPSLPATPPPSPLFRTAARIAKPKPASVKAFTSWPSYRGLHPETERTRCHSGASSHRTVSHR